MDLPPVDQPLHVLVDTRVAESCPELRSLASFSDRPVNVVVFDGFMTAPELMSFLGRTSPHVLIVDRVWLAISSMLMTLVGLSVERAPRVVLGVRPVDDMHKVEAAYHGFDDVIDLGKPAETILRHLLNVSAGRSSLDRDVLWTRISRPTAPPSVLTSPQDELDHRIIDLICIGLPDKEIAEVTHHSHQTIRNRISGLLHRTGLMNRTQMAWLHQSQVMAALMLENLNRQSSDNLRA